MKSSASCNGNLPEGASAEVLGDASAGYIVNVVREKGEEAVRIPPSISAKLKTHQVFPNLLTIFLLRLFFCEFPLDILTKLGLISMLSISFTLFLRNNTFWGHSCSTSRFQLSCSLPNLLYSYDKPVHNLVWLRNQLHVHIYILVYFNF